MRWTCRTRASVSPPSPAPMIVTGVAMVGPSSLGTSLERRSSPQLGTMFQTCQDGCMATRKRPAERREDALSRERIVGAAIELLDVMGEGGLTFRALAAHLKTGPGAIYWH